MPLSPAGPSHRARSSRRPPRRRRPRRGTLLVVTALLAALTGTATPALTTTAQGSAPGTVPSPTATTSVITVKTGGDRSAPKEVAPLAGVQLQLVDPATDQPVGESWSTCVSGGDGDCDFVVPDTQDGGANAGREFVVRQAEGGVPPGWYTNPELRTGPGSGSQPVARPYEFDTPAMAAGETYRSTDEFMYSDDRLDWKMSGGIWQQSRNNPALPQKCGLDVALVLDVSSSVGSRLPNLKRAADRATDGLTGTASRMAVYSFSGTSPSTGNPNHPELQPVSTQAGADAFKAKYADYQLGSGTNWDQGLYKVAEAQEHYDLVVVLTDGNPTRWSTEPLGDGSRTHFRDVENGIFSANAVKAKGSRVVALGVGTGVSGATGLNLRAISGPEAYNGSNLGTADYAQTANYEAAGDALHQLALSQCDNSVTVTKQLVPARNTGEDVSGARPAGEGWTFDATTTTPGIGGLPDSRTTPGDGTGTVVFSPEFPTGTDSADVTVAETQKPGYALVTQSGNNAVCVNKDTGADVDVTNASGTGFTVEAPNGAAISCTVYNREPPAADITVEKSWRIDGDEYAEGDQPEGFQARLTLTGPENDTPTDQEWGEARTGYARNATAGVDERLEIPTWCRVVSQRITEENGDPADARLPYEARLVAEHNTYRLTNTVECGAQLTLVKQVEGGDAKPTDWVLHASGPTQVDGESGSAEVTDVRVEPGSYQLSEEGGPEGYTTSNWTCEREDGEEAPVTGGSVTLARGTSTTCTVTNTAKGDGGWTTEKRSGPPDGSTVDPGSTITYTITVRPENGTAGEVALSDDLSHVLDHATLVAGSIRTTAGKAQLDGTALNWHIPELGGEETLTYRVRVDDDAHGQLLANAVTPGDGGTCGDCEVKLTTAPRPGGGALSQTGSGYPMLAAAGAVLLLTAGTVFVTRRRRRASGTG